MPYDIGDLPVNKNNGAVQQFELPLKIQLPEMPLFSPVQKIPKVDQTSRKDARTS